MLLNIFEGISSFFLFLILHVTGSNAFPKPLTAKEEEMYLERMKNGDKEAKNKLVEHNLRLVAHIIKKYYASSNDQDDLVSIGTVGLIKAINTFNPEKNIKLSSYASRCIENEILMHFRSVKKRAQDISLNEAIDSDKDGNPLTLMDIMSCEDNIIDDLDIKIKSAQVREYINQCLTKRERTIIILRYGLNNTKPLTQREVAQMLKISRSYVSRIETKALGKLRKCFEKEN
ncbi:MULTISPECIES: RNA polymerase sporulation sigma factor SigK [unclassified Ruminococcus]|uniref:RNA polymerase sporulation sigma factor SigK n=1 Tax=unclassified Ruminococcus TaxID=2608920 RepID=UPI00210AA5BE|nr:MULTISPECIES: RNA polymerase sporulation sigma factor SigK [unclassified Ruminococcus]MCQ4022130.1 sigma-70 family RNA polymerase sigma factor [Ruminococcus sp. zg-924]MCQ4114450.1 sigma-70 family RNA polymerase sigma factor [Ruminococcus sp. zg-921]